MFSVLKSGLTSASPLYTEEEWDARTGPLYTEEEWVEYVNGLEEESNQENQEQDEDNQAVESNARIVSYGDGGD